MWMNVVLYIRGSSTSSHDRSWANPCLGFGVVATFAAMADQQKTDHAYPGNDPGAISLLCLQGVCGAALVVGIKILPAYYGLNLIAHPVAAIRLALVQILFSRSFPSLSVDDDSLHGGLVLFFLWKMN